MTKKTTSVVYVKSEKEITDFIERYKALAYSVCTQFGLNVEDRDSVLNKVVDKFAQGKLEFNASKGAKYTTFLREVFKNAVLDEKKIVAGKCPNQCTDDDSKEVENVRYEKDFVCELENEDDIFIVTEALRRLTSEVKDKTKVLLLVRYCINNVDRNALARYYGVTDDYVSLQKSRYYGRLKVIVHEVQNEDYEGRLELTRTNIDFLKPYIKKW